MPKIEVTRPEDPWQAVTTRSGLPADEVISALQKSIRRGMLENAVLLAQDMAATSPELEEKLWARLSVISVEDIGPGDVNMPVRIETLNTQRQRFDRGDGDRMLFAVHAVRLLCESTKDRSSDDLTNWALRASELGEAAPEIPDVALDMHTKRGQEMGRDYRYFLEEASRVVPMAPEVETRWRKWLIAALDAGKLR